MSVIDEWILPEAVKSGCFGKSAQLVNWKTDQERKGEDQFSSTVQFLEISTKTNDGPLQTYKVVLKLQGEEQAVWDITNVKEQFQNEILFYSEILPTLNKKGILDELFCKFHHGVAETNLPLKKDFLLLEDLRPKGYRLNSEVFLDFDHMSLALKQLGVIHGLSYVAKHEKPKEFQAVASKIQDKWSYEFMMQWKEIFILCGERGIKPLIKKGKSVELLKKVMKSFEDPGKLYYSTIEQDEPESVICPGDFNRNNMLFRYDEKGQVQSVKFFDFQTPLYASPVIDLSFFLFMNTNKETRSKYWDALLSEYKSGVKSVCVGIPVPEINFQKFAIYGYIIASYFLPFMLHEEEIDLKKVVSCSSQEQAVLFAEFGGERGTEAIADIVEFLLDRDYLLPEYY